MQENKKIIEITHSVRLETYTEILMQLQWRVIRFICAISIRGVDN